MNKFTFIILWCIASLLLLTCNAEKSANEKWQNLKSADFTGLLENAYEFIETPYFDSICGRLNDSIALQKYAQVIISDKIDTSSAVLGLNYNFYEKDYFQRSCLRDDDLFLFCLKSQDSILLRNEFLLLNDIKDRCKEYISNPANNESFSEKKSLEISILGNVMVSKGRLTLLYKNDKEKGMSIKEWKLYFLIIDEFHKAYSELRNEFAKFQWNTLFKKLNFERKVAVTKLYPTYIELNFRRRCGIPLPPPPPPADIHEVLDIVYEE